MKKLITAFVLAVFLLSIPASAMDRVQFYYGLQPPSSWLNIQARFARLGIGQFMFDAFGSTTGLYSNLSISTPTGLYITVGPTIANSRGSVYQFLQDDTTTFGGALSFTAGLGSATALPTDATQVMLQGLLASNVANILLTAPGTAGQSINHLIECRVSTTDTSSQSVNSVNSAGAISSGSANRDRADMVVCQGKPGTAAASGAQTTPTVDAGWVGIGYVTVANGTATLTNSNVTAYPAFTGFSRSGGGGQAYQVGNNAFVGANAFSSSANIIPVTITASSPQNVDVFDVFNAGQTVKYFAVNNAGVAAFTSALTVAGLTSTAGASITGALTGSTGSFSSTLSAAGITSTANSTFTDAVFARSAATGVLYVGSNATQYLDYGVTSAGRFSLTGGGLGIAGPFSGATTGAFSSSLSASSLTATGLTVGNCVQVTTGGLFTTAAGACGTAASISSVSATAPLASSGGTTPNISITGILGLAFGGTGSATQNFLDLTNAQTAVGLKTFSSGISAAGVTSTAGVAAGGALTGATSGAFSGIATTGGLSLAADGNVLSFGTTGGNMGGTASTTYINNHANTASNVVINDTGAVSFPRGGVGSNGLGTFVGLTAGTGTVQGSSNGATVAYTPPVYNASGAATASTTHSVFITGTGPASTSSPCGFFSGSGYCSTIALTGAAAFASASTFSCSHSTSVGPPNPYYSEASYAINWNSGSTLYVPLQSASLPYAIICTGT